MATGLGKRRAAILDRDPLEFGFTVGLNVMNCGRQGCGFPSRTHSGSCPQRLVKHPRVTMR
jgi:hypothetical protein